MRVFGLVNLPLGRLVDAYATEPEAQVALTRVLADEPDWTGELRVEQLDLEVEAGGIRVRSLDGPPLDLWFEEVPPPPQEARSRGARI